MSRGNVDALVIAIAHGRGLSASAELACMGRTTAWRHLQDPEVAARVEDERVEIRETLSGWLDQIMMVGDLALERVVELLSDADTPPHVVARVAIAVLNERRSVIEVVEMEERLTRLEARADGRDPDDPDGQQQLRRAIEGTT